MGPPGTGKGTIAKFIEVRFGLAHVSTGDLLREEIVQKTETGRNIEPIMAAGQLVEDVIALEILEKKLSKLKKNFILDGFPRTLNQGELLEPLVKRLGIKIDLVLEIDSSEELIVKRLSSRRQCVKCHRIYGLDVPSKAAGICDDCNTETVLRDDDRWEVIKKRLDVYNEVTKSLSDFYADKKLLKKVDGNRTLQEIFMEVEKLLSPYIDK